MKNNLHPLLVMFEKMYPQDIKVNGFIEASNNASWEMKETTH